MSEDSVLPSRVLIVDDNAKVGVLIAEIFDKLGFDIVEHTSTGAEALERIASNPYSLVVCDLQLGDIDGMAVLKAIKGDEHRYRTGFILSETTFTAAEIMAAYRAGADGFLVKPFSIPLLRQKLHQVLRPSSVRRRYVREWTSIGQILERA